MTKTVNIFVVAAAAATIAGAAAAQTTTFTNEGAAADQFDDLQEQIAEDAERDVGRFGNEGRVIGTYGSVALRAAAANDDNGRQTFDADGNLVSTQSDEDYDVGVGLRYGMFDGVNGIDVTATYNYSEVNGVIETKELLMGADYRRDFGDRFFGYGKLDAQFDDVAQDNENFSDIFVGAGVGYRIYNDATSQWSVQAGPGYRFTESVLDGRNNEAAASISSNYYRSLSETSYVTNDTDVIYSDSSTIVTNELALSVALSNALSLRTSLATAFDDSTDSTFGEAQNTLGVAVVYNFN